MRKHWSGWCARRKKGMRDGNEREKLPLPKTWRKATESAREAFGGSIPTKERQRKWWRAKAVSGYKD